MTADSPARRKSLSKYRKNLDVAARDARACRMYYADRMTYREIAEALGMANESVAKKSADRGLKAIQVRGNENLVAEVRARIEENREFVRRKRDNPPQKVSLTGRPVYDDDGRPVYDDAVSLTAASELRKLDQQTIDLLGLAAPRRSITATIDAGLDARLAANEQLLQARLVELTAENERLRRQIAPADVHEAVIVEEAS
jgi:DNA-binding transcriptional regulator LsrR (DeoR family)